MVPQCESLASYGWNLLWSRIYTITLPYFEISVEEALAWGGAVLAVLLAYWLGQWRRRRGTAGAALELRLQAQERALAELVSGATDRLGERVLAGERRSAADAVVLRESLSRFAQQQDGLRRTLTGLEAILSNKQARGAFGEAQLARLVSDLMPSGSFKLQAALGPYRVDCLVMMGWPPGPVSIDAKFPLEGYQTWQAASTDPKAAVPALKRFQRDVAAHVEAIAAKYIRAGETADFALMFLPSEAVFSALHNECRSLVEIAARRRVFVVSPSTLWPLLNTLAGVLRDVQFAENGAALQAAARQLADDSVALADLAIKAQRDWRRLGEDLQSLAQRADTLALAGRAFANGAVKAATETEVAASNSTD
jgi:DNA recombination protein RmuC